MASTLFSRKVNAVSTLSGLLYMAEKTDCESCSLIPESGSIVLLKYLRKEISTYDMS